MNELQKFEHDNKEKLFQFLDNHRPGHDDIQLRHFIIDKSGVTDYGKYKQCLAEIHTRYNELKNIYHNRRKIEAEIKILEAEKNELGSSDLDTAKKDLKDIEIEERNSALQSYEKSISTHINELTKFFALAIEFEKSIKDGNLEQMEAEYWIHKLSKDLEVNILWNGGNLSGVMHTIDSLPDEMKIPLIQQMHNLQIISRVNQVNYFEESQKRKELTDKGSEVKSINNVPRTSVKTDELVKSRNGLE